MPDQFDKLYAHLSWADTAVLDALAKAADPRERWLELYGHVLGAEHVWLSRLEGVRPEVAVWPGLSLEQCRDLALANYRRFVEFLKSLKPADRQRGVTYTNSAGDTYTSTVEDILLHVCLHGSYHRGQIATGMREAGAVPAPTDYIGFTRGAPAATRR